MDIPIQITMVESSENIESSSSKKKSTLKILEEVDKEILKGTPPNFTSHNYTRVHDSDEGRLHG